jgi:hypothetical protein
MIFSGNLSEQANETVFARAVRPMIEAEIHEYS